MLFKQIQIFALTSPMQSSPSALAERLEAFAFQPCLPSMPSSMGWVAPIDEEGAPLTRGLNGCIMLCLQLEEKILPGSVITQALKDKVKKIEQAEGRKVRQKEKLSHKDEITQTLLMRAFTKFSRMYAYIDTKNGWLILNGTSPGKTEQFITMFKKTLGDIVEPCEVIKPSAILTDWLKNRNYPASFAIEKSCVLQDPNHQNRMIRCREQDLFASSIQSLLKDGCEAVQIGLCWHDRINFTLAEDFSLRAVHLAEDDLVEIKDEMETKQQKFDADFIMMTEMFGALVAELLGLFTKQPEIKQKLAS